MKGWIVLALTLGIYACVFGIITHTVQYGEEYSEAVIWGFIITAAAMLIVILYIIIAGFISEYKHNTKEGGVLWNV